MRKSSRPCIEWHRGVFPQPMLHEVQLLLDATENKFTIFHGGNRREVWKDLPSNPSSRRRRVVAQGLGR